MATYFNSKNSKNKYFYKIFDLDNNDLDILIEEAINEIDTWSGEKYCPDLYINICCNDEIILPSRVLNGLKNGINEICRSSYALITTSINIFSYMGIQKNCVLGLNFEFELKGTVSITGI